MRGPHVKEINAFVLSFTGFSAKAGMTILCYGSVYAMCEFIQESFHNRIGSCFFLRMDHEFVGSTSEEQHYTWKGRE